MEIYDKRGIPIRVGDMLKTVHFKNYRRRWHYLYHVVYSLGTDGMVAIPLAQALGGKAQGGDVALRKGDPWVAGAEIVASTQGSGVDCGFEFRKRLPKFMRTGGGT